MKLSGIRAAVLGALVAGVLAAPGGHAAACPMLPDAEGDAGWTALPIGLPASSSMDIVGADIVSNARVLTTSVAVADLGAAGTESLAGVSLSTNFDVNGIRYRTEASHEDGFPDTYVLQRIDPFGPTGETHTHLADVSGVWDLATSSARVHVPVSLLRLPKGQRSRATFIGAYSFRGLSTPPQLPRDNMPMSYHPTDYVEGEVPYVLGAKGCIQPGR